MQQHTGRLKVAILTLCLAFMVSCGHSLIPRQVNVNIRINDDRTYDVALDGRVLSGKYVMSGLFEEAGMDENKHSVEEEIDSLQQDKNFRSVCYVGDGEYEVSFRETGILDQHHSPLDDFSYMRVIQRNVYEVVFKCDLEILEDIQNEMREDFEKDKAEMTDSEREQSEKFLELLPDAYHRTFDGLDWRITLETDAEVIEHNAEYEPWFFGLIGGYEWRVTSPDDPQPYIILKLDTPAPGEEPPCNDNAVYMNNTAFDECPGLSNYTGTQL